jgi:hypothetical protein
MIEDTRPIGDGGVLCTLRQLNPEMADIYEALHRFDEDEVGPFDTTLTPYPSRITLGDYTTEGWKNVREYGVYPGPLPFTKEEDAATTADLDARDHFASEVRALHPTQMDRIEKMLGEVLYQLDIRRDAS